MHQKHIQNSFDICRRANPSKNVSCNQFSLSWGSSKILQPLSGGRHSRLSICQTQPKKLQILRRQCCLGLPYDADILIVFWQSPDKDIILLRAQLAAQQSQKLLIHRNDVTIMSDYCVGEGGLGPSRYYNIHWPSHSQYVLHTSQSDINPQPLRSESDLWSYQVHNWYHT